MFKQFKFQKFRLSTIYFLLLKVLVQPLSKYLLSDVQIGALVVHTFSGGTLLALLLKSNVTSIVVGPRYMSPMAKDFNNDAFASQSAPWPWRPPSPWTVSGSCRSYQYGLTAASDGNYIFKRTARSYVRHRGRVIRRRGDNGRAFLVMLVANGK